MPFVAERAGEVVVPEEVSDDGWLTCLNCGDELRVRQTHERNGTFVARHFWHVNGGGGGGCSGGESETHRRLKSIVLSKLKHMFPCAEAGLEQKIGRNIADVYAIFEKPMDKFGEGVVVEVQYRNEGKDIIPVSRNYLEEGFSVCWIEQAEIDGMGVNLSSPEWFYADRLDYYEQCGFVDFLYDFDDMTGLAIPPLYCPDCDGMVTLEEIDGESSPIDSELYGCPECGEVFTNSHYGPIVPRDYYGNREVEQDYFEITGRTAPTGPEGLTCLNCVGGVPLHAARGTTHAYENGQVYECPQCGGFFLENDQGRQAKVKRVTHEGNLEYSLSKSIRDYETG